MRESSIVPLERSWSCDRSEVHTIATPPHRTTVGSCRVNDSGIKVISSSQQVCVCDFIYVANHDLPRVQIISIRLIKFTIQPSAHVIRPRTNIKTSLPGTQIYDGAYASRRLESLGVR